MVSAFSTTLWVYAFGSVALVSLISLAGVFVLSVQERLLKAVIFLLVSLSAGALFGDVFLHLLPELFEESASPLVSSLLVLVGILSFFALEKFLYWRHCHTEGDEEEAAKIRPLGRIVLVGDGVHNLIDGIIIAASYLASIELGIVTTFAVILHEIPQEIGDFGVLLHSGFSKTRALFLNFVSAIPAFVGALLTLLIGSAVEAATGVLLALAAGTFLYIAGSDLVPEIHKTSEFKKSLIQFFAVLAGIGLMALLLILE